VVVLSNATVVRIVVRIVLFPLVFALIAHLRSLIEILITYSFPRQQDCNQDFNL